MLLTLTKLIRSRTALIIALAVFLVFGARLTSPLRQGGVFSSSTLPSGASLSAQVVIGATDKIVVIGADESFITSAKTRAENIKQSLTQLQSRIQALRVQAAPRIAEEVQFVGNGVYNGAHALLFRDAVEGGAAQEMTALVINTGANAITPISIQGLASPFSLLNPSLPFTDRCGGSIAPQGTCSLVFLYAPDFSKITGESETRTKLISFESNIGDSNQLLLVGSARKNVQNRQLANTAADDLTVEVTQPQSALPGDSSLFLLMVKSKSITDARHVFFKDVNISGFAQPFSIKRNYCAERPVHSNSCVIEGVFQSPVAGEFQKEIIASFNVGAETRKSVAVVLSGRTLVSPQALNPAKHLLVVYNESWSESVEAKEYYLANRPGFSNANILGLRFPFSVACPDLGCLANSLEVIPFRDIREKIAEPIFAWLRDHLDKNIQYIVLMRGFPTRGPGGETPLVRYVPGDPVESVQRTIQEIVASRLGKGVFVTSLDMGSLEATKAYIDKLKSVYTLMPVKSPVISARGTNKSGTTYYFSNAYAPGYESSPPSAKDFADALKAANPAARIIYKDFNEPILATASDVSGFLHRGIYGYKNGTGEGGWNGDYAVNGTVKLSGKSGWWLAQSVESFNGLWMAAGHQGNFIKWFSANAYGGTNYSNTPVAAVTHTIEPTTGGINKPYLYVCWDSGLPFGYCAWKSANTPGHQAVGDPWVTR